MATIAVLLDLEESHFLTTFSHARDLRAKGHRVVYLGLPAAAPFAQRQGFEFLPIGADLPAGGPAGGGRPAGAAWFAPLVTGELLDRAFAALRPQLVLLLSLYYPEAIVVGLRYGLPVLMLNPHGWAKSRAEMCEIEITARMLDMKPRVWEALAALLGRAGVHPRSTGDLVELALRIPELVFLPRAFEPPGRLPDPEVVYVGPAVDLERAEDDFPWELLEPGRPLVYCSLGSQGSLAGQVGLRFYREMMAAAAAAPWQLLLAVGRSVDRAVLPPPPANVHLADWVPQLAVLRRADVMVTHGGIGSVKECILMGVPMVALPLMRDQFDSADRLARHGLGLVAGIGRVDAAELASLIREILDDAQMRRRIGRMREEFLRTNDVSLGTRVAEEILARHTGSAFLPQPARHLSHRH
jgi:MGT family glycosyltransferase